MIALRSLSLAMFKGYLRDKQAVFFSIFFPLMFLVLFGGVFSDQSQSKISMVEVGSVPLIDDLPAQAKASFDQSFDVEKSSSLSSALDDVRNGDVTIAVEQDGDKIIAHYSDADQVVSAVARGTLYSFIQSSNIAASGQSPKYSLQSERIEDESLKTIQFMTPGLLGWAIATSATFGAAATLVGWRSTKLLRRIRLSPVSTSAVVSARIGVTMVIALMQMAIFLVLGVVVFGLQLTGSWYMAVPLVLCGTLAFMSLGLLAGSVSKTVEGATSLANIFVLPMAFLSGSFGPRTDLPAFLRAVADVLPLTYFLKIVNGVYLNGESLFADPGAVAVVAAWGLAGVVVARRRFSWVPRT